jgi:hypothetical protein
MKTKFVFAVFISMQQVYIRFQTVFVFLFPVFSTGCSHAMPRVGLFFYSFPEILTPVHNLVFLLSIKQLTVE